MFNKLATLSFDPRFEGMSSYVVDFVLHPLSGLPFPRNNKSFNLNSVSWEYILWIPANPPIEINVGVYGIHAYSPTSAVGRSSHPLRSVSTCPNPTSRKFAASVELICSLLRALSTSEVSSGPLRPTAFCAGVTIANEGRGGCAAW